jgi:hypothetical protein
MDCPLCGWPITNNRQWESHNKLCAIWECVDCETTVTAQTPLDKVKAFKANRQGGKSHGKTETGSN